MSPIRARPSSNAGFTLVEMLVGVLMGVLSTLVVMQVFATFEGQKRVTVSGGDAQTNGAIALYSVERDLHQAGYGISSQNLLGCNLLLRTGITLNNVAPVTINHASIPAGDANTDTLLVVYGNSNSSTDGDGITSQPSTSSYAMQAAVSFSPGDRVIATPQTRASPCNLSWDTVANVTSPNVTVTTGVAGMANGTLYNLGPAPQVKAYAIRAGNLTVCDYTVNNCSDNSNVSPSINSAVWVPIANNIVSLRAQYGRDTAGVGAMDGIVDTYDQTTPTTSTTPPVPCGWARVSALRFALVARNSQPADLVTTAGVTARETVTTSTSEALSWDGSTADTTSVPSNPTALAINLSSPNPALPTGITWQNYRYKRFQTVVPIQNVTWPGVQSGC